MQGGTTLQKQGAPPLRRRRNVDASNQQQPPKLLVDDIQCKHDAAESAPIRNGSAFIKLQSMV
jgi:hypothetical protein